MKKNATNVVERGTSKSAVSRRFVAATGKQLKAWMNRDLSLLPQLCQPALLGLPGGDPGHIVVVCPRDRPPILREACKLDIVEPPCPRPGVRAGARHKDNGDDCGNNEADSAKRAALVRQNGGGSAYYFSLVAGDGTTRAEDPRLRAGG